MGKTDLQRKARALEAELTPELIELRLQRLRRLHQFAKSLREFRQQGQRRGLDVVEDARADG